MKRSCCHFCLLALAGLLAVHAAPSSAADISIQRVYYDIDATTTAGLQAQVADRGPGGDGRDLNLGLTQARLGWRYTLQPGDSGCRIVSASGMADITVTLPRIRPDATDRLPARIQRQLSEFVHAVQQHEAVHEAYAVRESLEGEQRIGQLPAYPDCGSLRRAAHDVIDALRNHYQALNDAFDAASQLADKWPSLSP